MYVDTAMHRPAVTHPDTRRDKKETARRAAFPQPAGRFPWWWQVLGSNQRRLSRRFYRTLLRATLHTHFPAQTSPDRFRHGDAVRYICTWRWATARPVARTATYRPRAGAARRRSRRRRG